VESNFNIDWERLNISKKETLVNLGIRIGNKREPVYDNNLWVDTVPLDVTNFAGQENRIRAYEVMRLQELNEKNIEHLAKKDREIAYLKSKLDSLNNEPYQDKANLGKSQSHSAQKADDPKKETKR
jgi:hypothetical protein